MAVRDKMLTNELLSVGIVQNEKVTKDIWQPRQCFGFIVIHRTRISTVYSVENALLLTI